MAKPKSLSLEMEKSPLLRQESHSTISPDKLDQSRFSDRIVDDEAGSSLRILIYVVIVIVVGVGAALLIRNLIINNDNKTTEDDNNTQNQDTQTTSAFEINKTVTADAQANLPTATSSYVNSAQVTLGEDLASGVVVSLDKIIYTKYTTFARVEFDFSGAKLPKLNTTFDSVKNLFTVKLPSNVTVSTDLTSTQTISDLVTVVNFNSTTKEYTITLSEDSFYAVKQNSGNLIIDFKTATQLDKDNNVEETPLTTNPTTTTPTTTTDTTTTTDSNKPTTVNYTNNFSQKQQYIVSEVTGNTLNYNKFFYYDAGDFLELSFGEQGKLGEKYAPNATAYLKTENGKEYLYFEIENLAQEAFSFLGFSNNGTDLSTYMNTAGSNFVRIDRTKFENGKATYRIELKRKSDFKLVSQDTYDGTTQITSIQIKD